MELTPSEHEQLRQSCRQLRLAEFARQIDAVVTRLDGAVPEQQQLGQLLLQAKCCIEAQANLNWRNLIELRQLLCDYTELVNYLQDVEKDDGTPALRTH
jgi:hypothetical protein